MCDTNPDASAVGSLAGEFPGHRDEPRMGHHAVIGADASLRDVPRPEQDLERLDLGEQSPVQREDQGLGLPGRRQVRPEDASTVQGLGQRWEGRPRFWEVEKDAVEAFSGTSDVANVTDPEL